MKNQTLSILRPGKRFFVLATSAILAMAAPALTSTSQAAVISFTPTDVFNVGGAPNGGTGGALVATFEDVAGGVNLTLAVSGLGESYDNVNTWWFNVNPAFAGTLSASVVSTIGSFNIPVLHSSPTFSSQSDGDGYFNNWFNSTQSSTLFNGDSVTYKLTSSLPGLTAADFLQLENASNGSYVAGKYYTAVEIYGNVSEAQNLWFVGATDTDTNTGSPEPASLGVLTLGMAALLMRRRRA